MDREDGVRLGSLCPDSEEGSVASVGGRSGVRRRQRQPQCPTASEVLPTLDAVEEEEARAGASAPEHELCLFTSLTDAYVEGHVVFMASALKHSRALREARPPLYVLDQSLSARSRARVAASYNLTRWLMPRTAPKDVRSVTKFALNKEKTALFSLPRAHCGAVLKLDTGDMLATGDLSLLIEHDAVHDAAAGRSRSVWATPAVGQPTGRVNGGLMLFGRYWLHAATEAALEARAARESREQSLFGAFFAGHFAMLPKTLNVEPRLWDASSAAWRAEQRRALGEHSLPESVAAARILHFVGRDKPWMRLERGRPDRATDLCKRLRERESGACTRLLLVQALWWKAFGETRCLVVGSAAAGQGQGFVIDAFERVFRMHSSRMLPVDVGNQSHGQRCVDSQGCMEAARAVGCHAGRDEVISLGREPGLPSTVRSLLDDVYTAKHQIFGGPPVTHTPTLVSAKRSSITHR